MFYGLNTQCSPNVIDEVGRIGNIVNSARKVLVFSRRLASLGAGHSLYQAARTSSILALSNDTSSFARDLVIPTLASVSDMFKVIDQTVVVLNTPATFLLVNGSIILAGPIFRKPRSIFLRQLEKLPLIKGFFEQYLPQIGISAPFPVGLRGGVPGDRIYARPITPIPTVPNEVPRIETQFISNEPIIVVPNPPIQKYIPPPL